MTTNKVGIIDLNIGNVGSLINTIKNLNFECEIIQNPESIKKFKKLIIPGVGAYDVGMSNIIKKNWLKPIMNYVNLLENSLLGICLGMQLFSTFGHENNKKTSGLNLINGEVEDLYKKGCKLQLPHMGWNEVNFLKNKEPLFEGVPNNSDFYFVHKFAFFSTNKANIIGTTNYDINFASVLKKNNIFGVQFHPEKSSFQGKKILYNFLNLNA